MEFKTRGPLKESDAALYLARPADLALERWVKKLGYVALIGPRLSGKTSMLLRLWRNLTQYPQRYCVSFVNCSALTHLEGEAWFTAFWENLQRNSGGALPGATRPLEDGVALQIALSQALDGPLGRRALVVLLDAVELVPPGVRSNFFATLRLLHEQRGMDSRWERFTCVLAGSYNPNDLIADQTISPFRVAEKVYIEDAEDTRPLVNQLATAQRSTSTDTAARLMEWTEGDVYLTQRLCALLGGQHPKGLISPAQVDQIATFHLREDDLFSSLSHKLEGMPRALSIIRALLDQQTSIRFAYHNQGLMQAWLLGCIKRNRYENAIIRNPVYEQVLREVIRHLPMEPLALIRMPPVLSHKSGEPEPLHGRYVLEEILKHGDIHFVYRGLDAQTGQAVVIKQLLARGGADELLAWRRFQREGEALRRLSHGHIVGLLDMFKQGDFNYIVMEYLPQGTLDHLLRERGRLPVPLAMQIALDVADALQYAHQHGIVHRDIKPSNILLDRDFSARLADFGIARFMQEEERLTAMFNVVGTPAYIAPETYSFQPTAPTEDIWALGVTLYEMLAGTLPFRETVQNCCSMPSSTRPFRISGAFGRI
ncbi:MAG: protein kinase, partial [Anaerolineae bacterium]|nr:protein kinase [Anaerolineae bacterium]